MRSSVEVQLQVGASHQALFLLWLVAKTAATQQTVLLHEPTAELSTPVGSSSYWSNALAAGKSPGQVDVEEGSFSARPGVFAVLLLIQTQLDQGDEPLTWLSRSGVAKSLVQLVSFLCL